MNQSDLLVFGNIALDLHCSITTEANDCSLIPGGCAFNSALCAASMGTAVLLHGPLGQGPGRHLVRGSLEDFNIELRESPSGNPGLVNLCCEASDISGPDTGLILYLTRAEGPEVISFPKANLHYQGPDPCLVSESGVRVILAAGTQYNPVLRQGLAHILESMGRASENDADEPVVEPVYRILAPGRIFPGTENHLVSAIGACELLIVNEQEWELLTAARPETPDLMELRGTDLIITRGKQGGTFRLRGHRGAWKCDFPPDWPMPHQGSPANSVGAGDTLAGVLAGLLAALPQQDPLESISQAIAASMLTCLTTGLAAGPQLKKKSRELARLIKWV